MANGRMRKPPRSAYIAERKRTGKRSNIRMPGVDSRDIEGLIRSGQIQPIPVDFAQLGLLVVATATSAVVSPGRPTFRTFPISPAIPGRSVESGAFCPGFPAMSAWPISVIKEQSRFRIVAACFARAFLSPRSPLIELGSQAEILKRCQIQAASDRIGEHSLAWRSHPRIVEQRRAWGLVAKAFHYTQSSHCGPAEGVVATSSAALKR